MVEINKKEKEMLLSGGCVWHEDIHKSYSHNPKYYLTATPENLKKLKNIGVE